jgi:hypothetical protein
MTKEKVSFPDHPRIQPASLALTLAGTEWGGDPEHLLWECIAAIGTYGTSAKLKSQFDAVRAVAFIIRDLPRVDKEGRKRLAESLNESKTY